MASSGLPKEYLTHKKHDSNENDNYSTNHRNAHKKSYRILRNKASEEDALQQLFEADTDGYVKQLTSDYDDTNHKPRKTKQKSFKEYDQEETYEDTDDNVTVEQDSEHKLSSSAKGNVKKQKSGSKHSPNFNVSRQRLVIDVTKERHSEAEENDNEEAEKSKSHENPNDYSWKDFFSRDATNSKEHRTATQDDVAMKNKIGSEDFVSEDSSKEKVESESKENLSETQEQPKSKTKHSKQNVPSHKRKNKHESASDSFENTSHDTKGTIEKSEESKDVRGNETETREHRKRGIRTCF